MDNFLSKVLVEVKKNGNWKSAFPNATFDMCKIVDSKAIRNVVSSNNIYRKLKKSGFIRKCPYMVFNLFLN